jgi:phosphoribosylformimino-5-aminoimidazole carboxamide ribotide isomerase
VLTLYPAIDIRGGRAVRLLQGDYDRETSYDADPVDAARRWVDGGAEIVHVVDLDGARAGAPANLAIVSRIADAVDVPVQLGGGLRDHAAVEMAFAAGAARAVLGTSAQRNPDLLGELAAAYGDRIVASVDARGSRVAVEGWEEATGTTVDGAIRGLGGRGVRRFVYTPVEVDGTLEGPGLGGLDPILAACADTGAELIYSGGVGTLDDLDRLASIGSPALGGVIVGRAHYERRFTVADALGALGGRPASMDGS